MFQLHKENIRGKKKTFKATVTTLEKILAYSCIKNIK